MPQPGLDSHFSNRDSEVILMLIQVADKSWKAVGEIASKAKRKEEEARSGEQSREGALLVHVVGSNNGLPGTLAPVRPLRAPGRHETPEPRVGSVFACAGSGPDRVPACTEPEGARNAVGSGEEQMQL